MLTDEQMNDWTPNEALLRDEISIFTHSVATKAAIVECRACLNREDRLHTPMCEACQSNLDTIVALHKYAQWLEQQARAVLGMRTFDKKPTPVHP